MNKTKFYLVFLIISMCIFPAVNAEPFLKTLAPWSGDSQTEILAIIRAEKRTDNTPKHLYIFWNDLIIINRLCDTVINKKHTYMWDVTFKPPQDPRYLKKGSNKIVFWIEDIEGKFQTYTCVFTITDRIPQPSWLDDLTQKQIDEITGPQGEKGDEGPKGPAGPQGEKGDDGPFGPTGPQGQKGDEGIQGEIGRIGLIGVQGKEGVAGPQGERGPVGKLNAYISGATLLISIITIVIVVKRGAREKPIIA